MKFLSLILMLFSAFCVVSSCGEQYIPPKRFENQALYFKRDFKIRVIHPILGSGPNYVVRLYLAPEDAEARQYEQAKLTDKNGIAVFKDIRMGTVIAHCKVAGDPSYCALEYFDNIGGDTTYVDTLYLNPCLTDSD